MKDYFKWVSGSGYLARETAPGRAERYECSLPTSAGKPVLERLGNAFCSKKTPNLLNFTFLPSPPSSNPSLSLANPVGLWPGKGRIFPKGPSPPAPYLSSEEAGWIPLCWASAGKQSRRTGVFGCWSFLKAEHKFSFLLVDGFIICSEIKAFFDCKPGTPTNGCILCQFPSMLGRVKGVQLTRISWWSLWDGRVMGLQSQS